MSNRIAFTFALILAAALGLLSGCDIPRPSPTPAAPQTPDGEGVTAAPGSDDPSSSTPDPAPTVTPAVSPTALPAPPSGWQEYDSAETGIRLYYPPDWEIIVFDAYHVDMRAGQGEGWIELYIVDASSADDFSLTPELVGDAEAIAQAQYVPLQENGDFAPFARLDTRTGASAYSTHGTYDVLEDLLWVGVLDLGERAVLAQGHSLPDVEGWETSLVPVYEQILWGITPY